MREHEVFDGAVEWDIVLKEGLCLNRNAPKIERKYFIKWTETNAGDYEYRASYIVGAQWVDTQTQQHIPVIVEPKMDGIDFMKMFMTCFFSNLETDRFSKIYNIDFDAEPIRSNTLENILSPMIIFHFVAIVKKLLAKGLKKGYVDNEENLNKIKGHINIKQNDKTNTCRKRIDRFFCNFQEFSENTPENQLIKRALLFSKSVLAHSGDNKTTATVASIIGNCLLAMRQVDDNISPAKIKAMKRNKLFKEYHDALHLAKLILKRYDYNIDNTTDTSTTVPPFWIDMSLLYELYVYGLLDKTYLGDIMYQPKGNSGYPDFISRSEGMILDTKYIPGIADEKIDIYIIRQLAGYARDTQLLKRLERGEADVVPCTLIYPQLANATTANFDKPLHNLCEPIAGYSQFYKICVNLPTIATGSQHE